MIPHCLRVALLLAFVSATVGCGVLQPPKSDKKGTPQVRRPAQTGTYISRSERASAQRAERQKKTASAKPTATPKRKRERPKPASKVDEDFVTRGGFR